MAKPDTLASLNTEVIDPLLNSETSKAQEYLQGLLATADVGFTPVLRRRPVPLTDGPPNDEYIVCLNIASLHTHLYIDHVYRKIAELAALLAGSDIPKSPLGWVRLQTLQSYDGRDVPGNVNPTTQTVVATSKFSVLSKGNLRPMSKDVLETILFLDFKAQGGAAASNMPLMVLLHLMTAIQLRSTLSASHQPPKLLWDLQVPPLLPPLPLPSMGLTFCTSSMLEPLKRYGINPKTRSRDGFAVKLQPLASCDKPALADVLANSTLRGPQADTLLLVDIPSTRGSHTWTLTCSALIMHLSLRFTSTQHGSTLTSPCGQIRNAMTYLSTPVPTVGEDILNVQANARLAAHLREEPALIFWKRMQSLQKNWQVMISHIRKKPLQPFKSCSRLLTRVPGSSLAFSPQRTMQL